MKLLIMARSRVNVFLLPVYLERPENASYECMKSEDGSNIIRMYEAGREGSERKRVTYMHTGMRKEDAEKGLAHAQPSRRFATRRASS
jgi:hypothetical protein